MGFCWDGVQVEAGLLTRWGAESFMASDTRIVSRLASLESGYGTFSLCGAQHGLQLILL